MRATPRNLTSTFCEDEKRWSKKTYFTYVSIKLPPFSKKESSMSIAKNSSNANNDEANMAQDFWACVVTCHYDASLHSKCMVVSEADLDWFFDSGASKHITSCKRFFASLKDAPKGGHVVCANNASYLSLE